MIIDGIDTSSIGLYDLRSKLSLVPQDPVIFSGSIRSNLDPFGQVQGDEQIWGALRQAGLDGFVRELGSGEWWWSGLDVCQCAVQQHVRSGMCGRWAGL